jgi:hypothetical protein
MKIRAKVLIISPWGKATPDDGNGGVIDIKDDRVAQSLIDQGKAEAVPEAAEAGKPKKAKA